MTSVLAAPLADTWSMHDVGTGWWIAMVVMMVLFWSAIIIGFAWFARGGFGSWAQRTDGFGGWWQPRRETPTEILERRFAEGTIPVEEYQQRREVIEGGGGRGNEGDIQPPGPPAESEKSGGAES